MYQIADRLYIGDLAMPQKNGILRSLKKGIMSHWTYLVIRDESNSHIEIIHSSIFIRNYRDRDDITLIGLAIGRLEAMEVVRDIIDDIYNKSEQSVS